mgnify:CR=1 FL=1
MRPSRPVDGVSFVGVDRDELLYDVAVAMTAGCFKATVRLHRCLLARAELMWWSVDELVALFFMQTGLPARFGFRRSTRWHDVMGLLGLGAVSRHLAKMGGYVHDERAVRKHRGK